jgi:hypothetical protein
VETSWPRDAAAGACSNWSACRPASSSRQSLKQIPIWQAWLSRVLCTSCPHRSLASSEITTFIGALPSCSCTDVSFQRALVFSQKLWPSQPPMQFTGFLSEPRRTRGFRAAARQSENSFAAGLAEGRELKSNILHPLADVDILQATARPSVSASCSNSPPPSCRCGFFVSRHHRLTWTDCRKALLTGGRSFLFPRKGKHRISGAFRRFTRKHRG